MDFKKILLILSLFIFTSCNSAVYVDDGIIRDQEGNALKGIAQNDLGYDAWGRPKVINDATLFHGIWTYDIPKYQWVVIENGVEVLGDPTLAFSTNGMLEVTAGAEVTSKRHPRYQPNRGLLYSTAVILPNSSEVGVREWGIFNDENGYFFRLENGVLKAVIRTTNDGTTTEIEQNIIVPDTINLDNGNIYDIQAQWRGVGNIKFFINLQEVYSFDLLGTLTRISVSNPALPITYKTINGSNSIFSGCVDVTSEGGIKETRQYNSITTGEISLTNSETAVIVMKINETFKDKINTRDLSLRRITGYSDGNTLIRVYYTRDSSAITGGTWLNKNGGNIQYQLSPTFTQTNFTSQLVENRIAAFNDYSITNPDEDIGDFYLSRGDYIIVTLEAKTNTNGGVTIEWGEEI